MNNRPKFGHQIQHGAPVQDITHQRVYSVTFFRKHFELIA